MPARKFKHTQVDPFRGDSVVAKVDSKDEEDTHEEFSKTYDVWVGSTGGTEVNEPAHFAWYMQKEVQKGLRP